MPTLRFLQIVPLLIACACVDEEATIDTDMVEVAAMVGPPGTVQVVAKRARHSWFVHDDGPLPDDWYRNWSQVDDFVSPGPFGYGESYVATPLSFGSDPSHKHITTYFRQDLQNLPDAAQIRKLYLRVMYDDGFVFYINSIEGGRAHMPSGPITASTLALGHEAGNRYVTFDISAQIPNIGDHGMIMFEVHQSSPSSSDLVFDAEVIAWVDGPIDVTSVDSIPSGSHWHFWDQAAGPGDWKSRSYVDSGWSAARGPLGFGESYLEAETSPGTITTYFRKQFTPDPELSGMVGHVMYDDGFVVYLNGREVGRAAMPSGTITASTLSTGHEAGNSYRRFDWTWARSLLVDGVNVLAVEVHQSSASSSDLVFDLALEVVGGWSTLAEHDERLEDIWFHDARSGVAVGWLGRIWRTGNAGVQWTEVKSGVTTDLVGVVFADPLHGWATGDDGVLLRTVDGGATWTRPVEFTAVGKLSAIDAQTAWITATELDWDHGILAVFKTTDGGLSWQRQFFLPPFDAGNIYMADALHGWLLTRADEDGTLHIARTDDGGLTWTEQWSGGGFCDRLGVDFEVVDSKTAWMVGGDNCHEDGGESMYVTRDGGLTWTATSTGGVYQPMTIHDIDFIDAMEGRILTAGGGLLATSDGGVTWQGQQAPSFRDEDRIIGEPPFYRELFFSDASNGWTVAFGTVLHTSTGGW